MRDELDKKLCEKYPKIFRDRYAPINDTCMGWGFSCNDGWYNIIDILCANIQHHIDWKRRQRVDALLYNRALVRSSKGNLEPMIRYFSRNKTPSAWDLDNAEKVFEDIEPQCRKVPEVCPQVTATQVKEKFGTLRFYYHGGDDSIDGMVSMAESMSGVTCESCGNVGKRVGNGWIRTICEPCEIDLRKDY